MSGRSFEYDDHIEHPAAKRRKASQYCSLPPPLQVHLHHDDYTIGWICALHIEMAAARAMLDEVHEPLPRNADDTNSYVLGNIKGHNIVIAGLPAGQYGTINAATVATNLKRTFPGIRLTLMVGIGGGVPGKEDIRLGDIVVGTRIMQYDLGKIVADGKFERTAIPRVIPPLLATSLTSLQSKHELSFSRIPSILQQKLEAHVEYRQPSTPDRLFQAAYEHESQSSDCNTCDRTKSIHRSIRSTNTIKIHYGAIASGNQVMKHGTTRDNLARELDVICFEMEAAGLTDITSCLSIRGICDYSDSHKNKVWQKYAAATAAAYARELIEELPLTKEQSEVHFVHIPDQDTLGNRRQRLMKSLDFKQIESRKTTIEINLTKTCKWLLDHPDYKAWLNPARLPQHYGFLWISGKPGAGKSTIMKFAYMKMKHACGENRTASFFFNARGEYLEKSTSGLYRSLLLQLLQGYPDLQTILDDSDILPQSHEDCPPLNVLKELFRSAITSLGQRQFTCFVDALDECNEQQVMDMVEFFEDLGEQARYHDISFRVCFSSRHYPYIDLKRGIRLTLEDQPGHAEDLATYITSRLRIKNPLLIQELQPELLRKAAGVFMWVILVVPILNKEYRLGGLALRKRLAEIPGDLSKLFKDILTRDNENMDSLLLCVRWILFAERPLQPDEFCHALWSGLSLKDMADSQVPDAIQADDKDFLKRVVISSSKGLAEITNSRSPTVQFIHESVRDFLIKDNGLHELWPGLEIDWQSSSHEELKRCCQFYLNNPSVSSSIEDLPNEYPFSKYAAQNILLHADAAAKVVIQTSFLSNFPLSRWIKMNNKFEKFKNRQYTHSASLIYILADKGCPNLVRTWLQEDPHVHITEERYRYPLFAAVANCHKDTIAALLGLNSVIHDGVDITEGLKHRNDIGSYKNRTPLSWSAETGRLGIVKFLLENRCEIDEVDGRGRTAISRASENGHEEIARLLLDFGADINAKDSTGKTALFYAVTYGHETLARLLINKGADVNAKNYDNETALIYAVANVHEILAGVLVDKGADVNARDRIGKTALFYAVQYGHKTLARLLIDKGADVNPKDTTGNTALFYAVGSGHKTLARLLIDKGANINAKDSRGWTPLFRASMMGHSEVVKLFIDKGADINVGCKRGRTALSYAVQGGHLKVVQLLTEKGADTNAADNDGQTPILSAKEWGRSEILEFFMTRNPAM